jgi:hypothetical protein
MLYMEKRPFLYEGFKMSDATMKARIVRVKREEGKTGLFYATSPDLKGLLVAEPTLDGLERAIPQAIRDLYLACGVDVVVTRADETEDETRTWVAVPAVIARQALEHNTIPRV